MKSAKSLNQFNHSFNQRSMFDSLSIKLEKAFQTLKGQGRITEINVASTIKEIRKALIDADVNYKVAKDVTDEIKEKAMGQNVLTAISPGQLLTKITNDELTLLMGGASEDIKIEGNPAVILIAGLQGSGKTTFSGKLASYLKRQGRTVLLTACDIYRPAAIDQLKILGQQVGVEVYAEPENKDAIKIAKAALEHAKKNNFRVVIVDTAGRLAVDEEMMDEIAKLKAALNPSETLFVVDSMTGQDAVNTAKTFNERLNFDGVVLTKLDGDTRGGAALSIRRVVDKPIKFVSSGEKMEAIDRFYPDRMASRILGMGDVVSLVEKAQQTFDEDETRRLNAKMRKNQFDFNDFLSQLEQIKKMGNMKDMLSMIPGMSKAVKDVDIDDNSFKPIEAIIRSMTLEERETPDKINVSRKTRIAKGSGTSVQQVNQLLKQFEDMRKMMKTMNKMGGGKRALNALNPFGR
jgi:signal recognition particle subunit SRP54